MAASSLLSRRVVNMGEARHSRVRIHARPITSSEPPPMKLDRNTHSLRHLVWIAVGLTVACGSKSRGSEGAGAAAGTVSTGGSSGSGGKGGTGGTTTGG